MIILYAIINVATYDVKAQTIRSSNDNCLLKLESYAKSLNLVDVRSFDTLRKNEEKLDIEKCNFRRFRGTFRYKKAILLIVLKIDYYSKISYSKTSFDLIPAMAVSKSLRNVVSEYFYLSSGEEYRGFPYQEVQSINGLYAIEYIRKHRFLLEDKELNKWIKLVK